MDVLREVYDRVNTFSALIYCIAYAMEDSSFEGQNRLHSLVYLLEDGFSEFEGLVNKLEENAVVYNAARAAQDARKKDEEIAALKAEIEALKKEE